MTLIISEKRKSSQVEDSGDQILKEPAGKRWKKRWILQEYTGSHRNMEAVFRPENFRIFSGDFRQVPGWKHRKVIGMHRKKSGNFPAGILPPCSGDFRYIPAGTVRSSLTWDSINFNNFAPFSCHDFDFSEKIKITRLVSLLLHHFHCMTLVIRKNENHFMTFINFTSFSFHDFHDF